MRLAAHALADPPAPPGQDKRGALASPPFLAGMTQAARSALDEALAQAGGLILIAGPHGSGRATTLRVLQKARPDALAIGDMDSAEGAAAALAAARGRLVLATSGTGDSIAAVRRIAALGLEPFAMACVLRLVLAQRLAPKLCHRCRAPVQPPPRLTAPLGLEPGAVVYRPQGCGACRGKGFAGTVGAFEALPVDSHVARLIAFGLEEAAIANHVFRTWPNLAAAARTLVVKGFTSAEEAIALLRPQRQ